MKILLVNKFYYLKGGSERVVFDTKDILESHGHTVIPFAMQDPQNEPTPYSKYFVSPSDFNSAKGILSAARNIYSLDAKNKLEALIKKERPDVAHLHNAYFQISPSIFSVFKKYNIPVVLTAHDYHLMCPNYKMFTNGSVCQKCKGHKYYNAIRYKCQNGNLLASCGIAASMTFNKIFKFYEKGVDHITPPSKFMGKKLVEWGWDENKITNVPLGVDLQTFNSNVLAEDRKYILYFGRFSKEKGIPVLLKALESLPDVKVKIVGAGPMQKEVDALTANMPNVEVLPYTKNKQELVDIISHAQAVIVPSVWYENYPMSVMESLSCGTLVIGARIGGIPEQVIDDVTGYTFTPHDHNDLALKIKKVYNDIKLVDKLGKGAREFVEQNNSMETYYKRLLGVYEKVLGDAKGYNKKTTF